MTRAEMMLELVLAEIRRPDTPVRLTNPIPGYWTTLPPPAVHVLLANARWVVDTLLADPVPPRVESLEKPTP